MKRILFVFFALSSLWICSAFADMPTDLQQIMTKGKLIVALSKQDYPPFFYHNKKGEWEGFDIDIAKELAHQLGVKLEINSSATSFNEVINLVENETVDVGMGALSSSLSRALHVSFSRPYLTQNKALILNRVMNLKWEGDDPSFNKKDLKFGVAKNSSYESFLKEYFYTMSKYGSPREIVPYENLETGMQDLMNGKIYAIFTDEIRANYLLKNSHSASIYTKKQIIDDQTDPFCMAISHKRSALLQWINLFIENLNNNGTKNIFTNRYLKGLK
jgi:polar amino acid transport system substrate-binding protein